MIKNYFRILKKPHAYLHTILKTPVKFQKDWTETVGGVKGTKYPLKTRNHAPRTTRHAPRTTRHAPRATHHAPRTTPHRKPKTVSLHFSSKRRGTITTRANWTLQFQSKPSTLNGWSTITRNYQNSQTPNISHAAHPKSWLTLVQTTRKPTRSNY